MVRRKALAVAAAAALGAAGLSFGVGTTSYGFFVGPCGTGSGTRNGTGPTANNSGSNQGVGGEGQKCGAGGDSFQTQTQTVTNPQILSADVSGKGNVSLKVKGTTNKGVQNAKGGAGQANH